MKRALFLVLVALVATLVAGTALAGPNGGIVPESSEQSYPL